jgi:hypothetical protein
VNFLIHSVTADFYVGEHLQHTTDGANVLTSFLYEKILEKIELLIFP